VGERGDNGQFAPQAEAEKAKAYNRAKRILFLVGLAVGATYLVALLATGVSIAVTRRIESLSSSPWVHVLVYLVVIGLAYEVLALPLDFYVGFVLEHRYGQSTQRFRGWLWDAAKGLFVGFVIGTPLVEALYWLLRSYPETWWLIAAVLFIGVAVVMAHLAPVLLIPIFYTLTPLADEDLKRRLMELSERVGARVNGVYEIDMSRKTRAANAALVGLGNTRRIVLGDTLVGRYEPEEIEVILAHELAHHRHGDMWKGICFQAAISTLGFYVAYRSLILLSGPLGLRGPADVAGLPLLALTITAVSLLFLPISNAFSRHIERRADAFALDLTRNPAAFVSMMSMLGRQNLSEFEPNPLVEFLLYSHPSISRRIGMARRMFPDDACREDG
jgi:STE24 endopeptidase